MYGKWSFPFRKKGIPIGIRRGFIIGHRYKMSYFSEYNHVTHFTEHESLAE